MTFKILNGKIPANDKLQAEVSRLFKVPHLDWMPNNMIVQGDCLALIDFENLPKPKIFQTETLFHLVSDLVAEPDPEKVKNLFHKILLYGQKLMNTTS